MTWEYALIGLVVGIIIGAVAMRFGNRKLRQQQALQYELEKNKAELEEYREELVSHFARSAELLDNMAHDYRQLYQHMAKSSNNLLPDSMADANPFRNRLEESEASNTHGHGPRRALSVLRRHVRHRQRADLLVVRTEARVDGEGVARHGSIRLEREAVELGTLQVLHRPGEEGAHGVRDVAVDRGVQVQKVLLLTTCHRATVNLGVCVHHDRALVHTEDTRRIEHQRALTGSAVDLEGDHVLACYGARGGEDDVELGEQ